MKYLLNHKYYVFKCGIKLNIPIANLILHDISKFSYIEFINYARTYYDKNGKSIYEPTDEFYEAWKHHYKNNKHHWEFWIADDNTILKIPEVYLREMLADMIAMDYNENSLPTKEYYYKNKHKILMNNESRLLFESLLEDYSQLTKKSN